ncbi:MAG: DUF881 domain-containing protein [Clostridia bacterium]|nr:DUF881 domain-containing protein [Clostridia bacterium]
MKNKKISVLLGAMCFLLTIGIFIQVKTVSQSGTQAARTMGEKELRDNVLEMKEKYEKQYKILEGKEKELDNLIASVSVNDSTSSELSERLDEINSQIGLTALQGEGIIIRLEDGDEATSSAVDLSVVHDSDLKAIVNDLCIAGAEAISINGQRVVGTTAITCVGNVIKINDEKIGNPFEICAIGSKAFLDGAVSMNGRTLSQMKKQGVKVEIKRSDSVVVARYDGIFTRDYIR